MKKNNNTLLKEQNKSAIIIACVMIVLIGVTGFGLLISSNNTSMNTDEGNPVINDTMSFR